MKGDFFRGREDGNWMGDFLHREGKERSSFSRGGRRETFFFGGGSGPSKPPKAARIKNVNDGLTFLESSVHNYFNHWL